ncbi:hypothetical protein [Roseibium sp.]|uniref:hypothetical protein n=1 Tax=Roseibium sp. TaxID=1936156 RepID=UPI003B5293D0
MADVKNKGGRPPALEANEKTLKQIKGLGQIQATTKECAAVLGVSEPTFIKFKKDNPEAAEALDFGQHEGRASLRRLQFKAAEKGNAAMLIWLGKQLLGQRDTKEISGPNGGPIPTIDLSEATDEQLETLEAFFGPIAGGSGDDDAGDPGGEEAEG